MKERLLVGRRSECDIQLKFNNVSGQHARMVGQRRRRLGEILEHAWVDPALMAAGQRSGVAG
jgi:hypothetical protein